MGIRHVLMPFFPENEREKTAFYPTVELKKSLRILLLGSGGREHALAWKIAQSPKCEKLFIAPGNAGTRSVGENVEIGVNDFESLKNFAADNGVDMVVVGPEDPLVNGIYDDFRTDQRTCHIPVIGPSKTGAVLEGSKDFAKAFMQRHNIPTARYQTFDAAHLDEGIAFLETLKAPYVLKADGLCAGKGVLIVPTLEEAKKELHEMLGGMFGNASARVVIEEFLSGIECSVFVLTDGEHYQILPEAKDYKRIGEGDTGLNTGGMGSVSPVPFATKEWMEKVENRNKEIIERMNHAKEQMKALENQIARDKVNTHYRVTVSDTLSNNKAVSLIADAILNEPEAVQLVARSTGNNLEMEKDWELMSELDKDELLDKKIVREL